MVVKVKCYLLYFLHTKTLGTFSHEIGSDYGYLYVNGDNRAYPYDKRDLEKSHNIRVLISWEGELNG